MAKSSSLLRALPPFVFASLAFAFTVVTITSRDWARQHHYKTSESNLWDKPQYSLYRSPFQICSLKNDEGTDYTLSCHVYDPYGIGKTSCESLFVTNNTETGQTGDMRLCQEIHRAGNFAITATAFIGAGFVCSLLMTVLAYTYSPSEQAAAEATEAEAENEGNGSHHEGKSGAAALTGRHGHHRHHKYPIFPSYINLFLITAFAVGTLATLAAQFYGVLAFTQSAPDNALFAGGRTQPFTLDDNKHAPWIEGNALKAYATCAWVFSALSAGASAAVWRLPRLEKGI